MGAAEVVALIETLLTGGAEVAKLATAALAAWRAGDDQQALTLLDQALALQESQVQAARAELANVAARVAQRIADKFDNSEPKPTS